jgi:hypothetical protein
MENLEPELLIIEEHVNCRKSNEIQFILSKQGIPYWKVTMGVKYVKFRRQLRELPCILLGDILMGGIKSLNDFIRHSEEGHHRVNN